MKKIFTFMIIPFITICYYQAFSQSTDWTVFNECDCDISLYIVKDCNPPIVGSNTPIPNGGWGNPSNTTIHDQPDCIQNCTFYVVIQKPNNTPETRYDGEEFCCNDYDDCVTNDCVKIKFDYSNCTITLEKPPRCN